MRTFITVLILVLFGVADLYAQGSKNPGEVFIRQASFDHNEAVKQFTGDFTTLFDMTAEEFESVDEETNVASVNVYGNNNRSGISQAGWGNLALVNILGDGNTTGLKQKGNDNRFILNLEGSGNTVAGEQVGSSNHLRMDLVGSAQNQTFRQAGSNLTLQLLDNGKGGIPMQIEQRGNGATVIIENH